jgi:hypothetical protein
MIMAIDFPRTFISRKPGVTALPPLKKAMHLLKSPGRFCQENEIISTFSVHFIAVSNQLPD